MEFRGWTVEGMHIVSEWQLWHRGSEAVFTCGSRSPSPMAEYAGLMVRPPHGEEPRTCACSTTVGTGAMAIIVTVPPGSWVRAMLRMSLLGPWIDRVPTVSLWELSYAGASHQERHSRRWRWRHGDRPEYAERGRRRDRDLARRGAHSSPCEPMVPRPVDRIARGHSG